MTIERNKIEINGTMKVFDMKKVDMLIKRNIQPCGAGVKNNESYVLFNGTDKFWDTYRKLN